MKQVCMALPPGEQGACQQQADSLSGMTGAFGQGSHMSGQEQQCECFASKEKAELRHRAFLTEFYQSYNSSAATEENINTKLKDYAGKMGKLYYNLALMYGHKFVKFHGIKDE